MSPSQRTASQSPLVRTLSWAARLGLAGLFLYTGALKASDPGTFAADIANYRVLPEALVGPFALLLPALELAAGVALLLPTYAAGGALLIALMLLAFSGAMAQARMRGIDLDCGCFGAAQQSQVSWEKVALNLMLAMISIWVLYLQHAMRTRTQPIAPLLFLLVAASVLPATPPHAQASVVRALSLEDLVAKAEHVVVAVPEEKQARRHYEGRLIVTDVSLRLEHVLKGDGKAGEVLVATCLGGKLSDVALRVPGEATFAVGERVLVFLNAASDGQLHVVGMSQGVMPMVQRAGTTMVMPAGQHSALVEQAPSGKLEDAKPALTTPTPLDELLTRITGLVAAQRDAAATGSGNTPEGAGDRR